ncbi:MAG: hypothetical protein KDD22_03300 [Bdellovibrionales bacterium]|nr:hypothetical protein [Bdellovibrionales bacterium]
MNRIRKNILLILSTLSIFGILVGSFYSRKSMAGEMEPLIDSSISEKARKRLYPGGRDEEDLKVQAQLSEPALKYDRRTVREEVLRSLGASGGSSSSPTEAD